jgi:ABC-type molybdenum transport system ATPase subunit/photorepair protein PhrA
MELVLSPSVLFLDEPTTGKLFFEKLFLSKNHTKA